MAVHPNVELSCSLTLAAAAWGSEQTHVALIAVKLTSLQRSFGGFARGHSPSNRSEARGALTERNADRFSGPFAAGPKSLHPGFRAESMLSLASPPSGGTRWGTDIQRPEGMT